MARQLQPLPASFAPTMQGLHRLAEQVVKLTREHVSGEFSLIATPGGFGTLAFGPDDAQVRVEGADLVVVVGGEEAGKRANYGLSPGEEHHEEPYLYVGPWTAKPEGELWNGKGFTGAELDYSELVGADDQLAAALEFCRRRKEALNGLEV